MKSFSIFSVSLNRSLPDRRDDWCKQNILVDTNYLPSTSVIIIFHNEAWSTLLRTRDGNGIFGILGTFNIKRADLKRYTFSLLNIKEKICLIKSAHFIYVTKLFPYLCQTIFSIVTLWTWTSYCDVVPKLLFPSLFRTVYSVINRSPAHLLAEVILVDDASTLPRLGQELQDWVDTMDKVKLIRNEERRGLMVTRMKGVLESKSQVLTFLDSHIEATDGWLEPLLERIYLNPKAIACPVIEE